MLYAGTSYCIGINKWWLISNSGLCIINALRIIWTWTRATQNIWHTMGQVLPAAICGAFH